MTQLVRRRPEERMSDVMRAFKAPTKVDKTFTSLKASQGDVTGKAAGLMTPTDEQMEKINSFTRTPKEPDDVVVFRTLSCNDQYDRDDDGFRRGCIKQFAGLEQPFSFVGKSFMVSHDYTKLPVGRLFDVGTAKVEGVEFLTNDVYIPNTEANKSFIDNIDFGIYWAVSVGVVLEKSQCSICDAQAGSWFCKNGHEKGLYYDADSDEVDDWGWPIPCNPDAPNAQKACRDLSMPKDAYELSMCFLGAQYGAELSKRPDFEGVMKAASSRVLPIIGLKQSEADELPIPQSPATLKEAREKYTVRMSLHGDPEWVDEQGLKWVYDITKDEALCLGRSAEETTEDGSEELGRPLGADGNEGGVGGQDGPDEVAIEASGGSSGDAVERRPGSGQESGDRAPVSEEKRVSKKAVIAAAKAAQLPHGVVESLEGVDGDSLDALFTHIGSAFKSLEDRVSVLEPQAALGDRYLKNKRAEARAWYVKARQSGEQEPVSVKTFDRMLERIGDDVEMLDELISEQKAIAEAKFPSATRRSTFEADPNTTSPVEAVEKAVSSKTSAAISRIHG